VLRGIFGPKRKEITGGRRKLHIEEFHNPYSSPNIIREIKSRRMRLVGHIACTTETKYTYTILVGKSDRKRPLGRPRRRWEDNIRMDLKDKGW
jgi:hypothetical protein